MAGISIDFIDDDEFLELERCIASAERKYSCRTDVEAPQAVFGLAGPSVKRPAVNSPASLKQAEHHVSTKKAACKPAVRLFQQLQVDQQATWQAAPAASACPAGITTLQTAAVSDPLQDQGPRLKQVPQQSECSVYVSGVTLHRNIDQQLQEQSKTSFLQQHLPQQSNQLGRHDHLSINQTRPQHYAQPETDTHVCQQRADSCAKPQQIAQHQHSQQSLLQQRGHEVHVKQHSDLDKPLPQCKQQSTSCMQPPSGSAAWQSQQLQTKHDHSHHHNQWCQQRPAKLPGTADQQQGMQYPHAHLLHAPHEGLQENAQPSCSGPATICRDIPQLGLPRTASAPAVSGGCTSQQLSTTAAGGHSWGTAAANSGQGQGAAAATSGIACGNASGGAASGKQRSHSQLVSGCHTRSIGDEHAMAAGTVCGATWGVKQHVQHPVAQHRHQQVQHLQLQQHVHRPLAQQQRQQQLLVPHQQQQQQQVQHLQLQQFAHHPSTQQPRQQQNLVPHQQQQQQVQHLQLQQPQIQPPQQQQQRPLDVKQELQGPAGELHAASSNSTRINGADSSGAGDKESGPSAAVAAAVAPCTAAAPAGGNDIAVLPETSTATAAVPAASNGSSGLSGGRKLPPSLQGHKGLSGTRQQQQLQQSGQDGPSHQHQQQLVVPYGKPQKQLEFQGVVRYAYNPMEVDWLCRQMLDAGPPKVIGLDIEWRPTFKTGQAPNRTALLQIAYAVDKEGRDWRPKLYGKGVMVLLLHVYYTGITPALQEILQHEEIIKVGVNISGDVCKLLADFKVEVCSTDELSDAAHGRQLRCVDGITANTECKRWSLAGLVEEVLGLELPKPNQIRLGNWEQRPLSDEQKQYAALDAFASLLLHWELRALPERLTLSQQLRAAMRERAEAAIAAAEDG